MAEACQSDFVLAGGSAALDGLAVTTRLKCLLPDFDAQVVMMQNNGSSLQIYPIDYGHTYSPFGGYYSWLINQKYPDSKNAVGILSGASVITQVDSQILVDTAKAVGGKRDLQRHLPDQRGDRLDAVRGDAQEQGREGLHLLRRARAAGRARAGDGQHRLQAGVDRRQHQLLRHRLHLAAGQGALPSRPTTRPCRASTRSRRRPHNPATEQLVKLFAQYAPGQPLTLQDVQAWSAWLIFAKSAETCGSDLTRLCVYDAALKQTDWTGGGLTAPVDLSNTDPPPACFDVEQATASGWVPAPFGANNGAYRCGATLVKLPAGFPQPATLGQRRQEHDRRQVTEQPPPCRSSSPTASSACRPPRSTR